MADALTLFEFALAGATASLAASAAFEILRILFSRERRARAYKRSAGETIRALFR
jgi:hypothetical protein